jgi:hypothetical protein
MAEVQARWPSFSEQQTVSFLSGFSGFDGAEDWLPVLSRLFELSSNNDVRAGIVKTVHNMLKLKASPEIRRVIKEQLDRMPEKEAAYSQPWNYQFISKLKHQ